MATTDQLIVRMATDLAHGRKRVDLGDERSVILFLMESGYGRGDIIACMDRAIEHARRPLPLSSIMGDGAAAIFAAGVWLAWYVVLCPAVA